MKDDLEVEDVGNAAVVVDRVSKTFVVTGARSEDANVAIHPGRSSQVVQALSRVSFVARTGESIGLVGINGSGKSTLLRSIAGGEAVSEGRILVRSKPMLLGVNHALQNDLSGSENIYLGCLALGMSKDQARLEIPKIGEWTELGSALDRPMSTYSSGMGARLSFAISTSVSPDILLVDEALSTGDAAFVSKAEARMMELVEEAGNLFVVSHSLPMIERLCGRVIWLSKGEVVLDGPTEEVTPQYAKWAKMWADGETRLAADYLETFRRSYQPPIISISG